MSLKDEYPETMSVAENRLSLGRRQCEERRRYLAGLESLAQRLRADERRLRAEIQRAGIAGLAPEVGFAGSLVERHSKLARSVAERSEERRVGEECRSRWSPDH